MDYLSIPSKLSNLFHCSMASEPNDFVLVNAFASTPFGGNPAAVLFLKSPFLKNDTYLKVAQNFAQPMTSFILPSDETQEPDESTLSYNIRWFTVNKEAPMCGHGTLAAAHALFTCRGLPSTIHTLRFKTLDGVYVYARRISKPESPLRIQIELPLYDLEPLSGEELQKIQSITERALRLPGMGIKYVGRGSKVDGAQRYLLIELDEEVDLAAVNVDTSVFAETKPITTNIITVRSKRPDVAYEYRMFAPVAGVPEDHVCGSANCTMAPYWSRKLGLTSSEGTSEISKEMNVKAVSERSGDLWINVDEVQRVVYLKGEACTFGEGRIYI